MNSSLAIAKLRSILRRQHKAIKTEESYVYWLKRYMAAIHSLPQSFSSEQKAEYFLSDLAKHRDISAATQHQAFNALNYFYLHVLEKPLANIDALRVSRPKRVRQAPSLTDVRSLLQQVPNLGGYPTNLIARMLYGCGLRVSEPVNLRIRDVSLDGSSFTIREGKGNKERVIPLPPSLKPEIAQQMQLARSIWLRDQQDGLPLQIPDQLGTKYPEYQFAGLGPGFSLLDSLVATHGHGSWFVTTCMKPMFNGPSKSPGANLGSWCCHMNSGMVTPPMLYSSEPTLGRFRKLWGINLWKRQWAICTRIV